MRFWSRPQMMSWLHAELSSHFFLAHAGAHAPISGAHSAAGISAAGPVTSSDSRSSSCSRSASCCLTCKSAAISAAACQQSEQCSCSVSPAGSWCRTQAAAGQAQCHESGHGLCCTAKFCTAAAADQPGESYALCSCPLPPCKRNLTPFVWHWPLQHVILFNAERPHCA